MDQHVSRSVCHYLVFLQMFFYGSQNIVVHMLALLAPNISNLAFIFAGVTTMLNFFTTSNGFRSTLPVVSNLTAMNVWDGVCMCFIYASLLEFVCVNYVGRKRPLHNVVYRPGENPVTQVMSTNQHKHNVAIALSSLCLSLYLSLLFLFH